MQTKNTVRDEDSELHSSCRRLSNGFASKVIELLNISPLIFKGKSGNEALKGLNEFALANSSLPGIILVDLQMPGMDGYELVNKIKIHPTYNSRKTKIIIQTVYIDYEIDMPN